MDLYTVAEVSVGQKIGQLRAVPVDLGEGRPRAVLAAYSADFDVDPWPEMFFFPTDTLKLILLDEHGHVLWKRDLGPAVVPGMWFCPFTAFDLDGDGVDEIWFVNSLNAQHPLALSSYVLEGVDPRTGESVGRWPWPFHGYETMSHSYRFFILGGRVRGQPVLVTVQGTYEDMHFQAYRPDMSLRWTHFVSKDDPGARGSHMAPVVDINDDGVDELLWGERAIELDSGTELFCLDRDAYRGHSDVVWPFREPRTGRYVVYTCRESDNDVSPRVALFDISGERLWGDLDHGHMDMGWVAAAGSGRFVAMAIRIGTKTCGPDGRFHLDREEFVYDALTGRLIKLPFSVYQTMPVDINGDGVDELVRGYPLADGAVMDLSGRTLGSVGGPVALARQFCSLPGRQLLTYSGDGTVRIWADRQAKA